MSEAVMLNDHTNPYLDVKTAYLLRYAIFNCFTWHRTPQGGEYWNEVHKNVSGMIPHESVNVEWFAEALAFNMRNNLRNVNCNISDAVREISNLVDGFCVWSYTPQGHDYWEHVVQSLHELGAHIKGERKAGMPGLGDIFRMAVENQEKREDKKKGKRGMTADRIKDKLLAKGWEILGTGAFSTVLGHEKYPKVAIKINRQLDAWPAYVKWAADMGFAGTYAPRVYSLKSYAGFYVAVMERCDTTLRDVPFSMRPSRLESDALELSEKMGDRLRRDTLGVKRSSYQRMISLHTRRFIEKRFPGFNKFSREFARAFKGKAGLDVHRGNWMMQGERLVLTDPLACTYVHALDKPVKLMDKQGLRSVMSKVAVAEPLALAA